MKNIVLAAGYATRMYPLTENFPKPLLAIGDSTILDKMLKDVDAMPCVDEHIVVTNHKFYHIFEEWAAKAQEEGRYAKPIKLVDDGSTNNDNRIGAVGDLILALNTYEVQDDILVAAADNLLDFSLTSLIEFFEKTGTSVIFYYHELDPARLKKCGVAELDDNGRVLSMEEKPAEPKSNCAVPPFYTYSKADLPKILKAIENGCRYDAPGNLAKHISEVSVLHAMEMPGKRIDIGSLDNYLALKDGK